MTEPGFCVERTLLIRASREDFAPDGRIRRVVGLWAG